MENLNEMLNDKENYKNYIAGSVKTVDKNSLIVGLCQGKDVLDIGCIDHSYKTALELGENWIHRRIKDVAKSLTGLDLLEEDAKILNGHGYNIIAGDAENFNFDRKYDVIVAGDLIEHLSNIGLFLQCVKHHMHEDSVFIVTTPNPFCIEQIMHAIFQKRTVVNNQHSVWLDPVVMWQLMRREGFEIVNFFWVDTRFKNHVWTTRFSPIVNRLIEFIVRKVPLCRRDFALSLKRETEVKTK